MLVILLFATLAAGQVDISQQIRTYWGDRGLDNPPTRLRELADWSLLYYNTSNEVRPALLCTIATPSSIPAVLPRILGNLASFTTQAQLDTLGNPTSLASHTLVSTTNGAAQNACEQLTEKFYHKCYELDHAFNAGIQDGLKTGGVKSHAYSIGLSRIKSLLDLVSLGYDVLYFDLHHYFFKNPLKYMYSITTAPIVVSTPPSSLCRSLKPAENGSLPDGHHRLDIAFVRSSPSTFRCLFNWLYWSTHTAHDVEDIPLDHHTFKTVMQECTMSLGRNVLSVEYLQPESFPSECDAKCGCRNNATVDLLPDGTCEKDVMASWVGMAFSCSGSADELNSLQEKYASMYRAAGLQ